MDRVHEPTQPDSDEGVTTRLEREKARAALFGKKAPVHIGRHVVVEQLGAGAMGVVYAAYDPKLDRKLAVKLVRSSSATPADQDRLLREAQALAKVSHPNVVHVYDTGTHDGGVYLAMEFLRGQPLAAWMQQDHGWREVAGVFAEAAAGLAAAHDAGLVHRDFKPENAFVRDDGRVVVLDFGLARAEVAGTLEEGGSPTLTRKGAIVGTPAYASPEQLDGGTASARSDQFGFCASLFEALFGQRPFSGRTLAALSAAVMRGVPDEPAASRSVPAWLRALVLRGLKVDPEERWPDMNTIVQQLRRARTSPRQWVLFAGSAGVLGLVVVAGQAWVSQADSRCTGARAQLEGIWDAGQRSRVETAMLAVDVPHAEPTWARTVEVLDAYASDWVRVHADTCEATALRQEQSTAVMDLRMACLARARVKLKAVAGVLAEADQALVANAHKVVGGLRPLEFCSDVEALQAAVEPPPPEHREAVEAAREHVANAQAHFDAGRYTEGLRLVREAGDTVRGVEYSPAQLEIALTEGEVLTRLAKDTEAEAALTHALERAAEVGNTAAMQEAASRLLFTVGVKLERPLEALQRYRLIARRLAHDARSHARALNDIGTVLSSLGRYDEAVEGYREAIPLWEQGYGADHWEIATIRNNLANALESKGEYDEALAEYRAALELRERVLGADHPLVGASASGLGAGLLARGRAEEAVAQFRRAVDLLTREQGPDGGDVTTVRNNLGVALTRTGRYEEAEAEHRAALVARLKSSGPDSPAVASARSSLAAALSGQGKLKEAVAEHELALAARQAALGVDHPRVGMSHNSLGAVLEAQGQLDVAVENHRKALAIFETALGPEHPKVATSCINIASALRAKGALDEAERFARRGVAIREERLGDDHPLVAGSRAGLAEILLDRGEAAEALRLAESAWDRRQRKDTLPTTRAATAFVLARALWQTGGQRQRARDLARSAIEGFGSSSEAEDARAWLRQH